MKKIYALRFPLLVIIALIGMVTSQLTALTVTVKMRVNTSTCLDTLHANNVVQLQGESKKTITPAITWTNKTGVTCTNIGGDYWDATFQAQTGDTIKYKFVAFFDTAHATFHWSGYEGPITAAIDGGGNRILIVGANDTTLALQYFNGWESALDQYWRPFASKADSFGIYFRVNMGGANFDPATQKVEPRGGAPLGTDNPWIKIATLARETNSVNGGSFWSGVAYVAKSAVTPTTQQQWKYVIPTPETWESSPNRTLPVTGDTTINWVYFNNVAPHGSKVTANVLFRLKLDALEKAGLFNRAYGDKIGLTGAKGWPATPLVFDTDANILKMTYNSSIQEWNLLEPFTLFPTETIVFKYYIAWDSTRVDSTKPHFIRGLDLTNGWEEPGSTGGADRNYTYSDQTSQSVPGDFGLAQQYFNSLPPNCVITTPITLKFTIDMTPATSVTTNPTNPLFRPGVDTVYIQFDGCLMPVTQGKTMYGTDNRIRLTDPTGSGTYTGSIDLKPPTFFQACYRVVYTSPSGEITNGGGVQKGRRYYQYIHPTSVTNVVVWPSTYTLAQMTWAASNLTVEDPPNIVTAVKDVTLNVPGSYELYQNYPNPFNPSTVITYSIPGNAHVKIGVYNVLGQKVASLFDQEQTAGIHSIAWNALDDHGQKASSGVYLLKMQAGSFSQAKKMMLTK